ncbi:2726_t:CDS:1 [Ambispora leptoticha]|uniref:2726_t:CDS:1 n=1 Tax=Ambispora leptoticha TaxID=144679 RepID=A0A9N8VX11_9GLOM|nr:2726_t:CDS:1 [Ambispora leptoticha]
MKVANNKKAKSFKKPTKATKSPISKKRDNDYATTYKYEIERIKRILKFDQIPYTLDDIFNSESESLFRKADGKIKRPPNCFIFFRQITITLIKDTQMSAEDRKFFETLDQPQLSKILGALWKSLSADVKSHYKELCDKVVALHKKRYPDWKYAPNRSKAIFKVVKFDSHVQEPQYQETQYEKPQYQDQSYEIENQPGVTPEYMQVEYTQAGLNQTPVEPCNSELDLSSFFDFPDLNECEIMNNFLYNNNEQCLIF